MKAASEMPTRRIVQHKDYNQKFEDAKFESFYNKWKFDLVSCEISESELEKIIKSLSKKQQFQNTSIPIEVTEIVESKVTHQLLSMPPIDCYELFFKQPSDNNGVITFKANKNMKKPLVIEVCTDNGEFSHWSLIDLETSEKLWSENPEECKAMGYPVKQPKQVDGEIEAVDTYENQLKLLRELRQIDVIQGASFALNKFTIKRK